MSTYQINASTNMLHTRFHVCPACGNVISTTGEADVRCHGVPLSPLSPRPVDGDHQVRASCEGDELFVEVGHPMEKEHGIVFVAATSPDCVQIAHLYPEGSAEAHFHRSGIRNIYVFCNRDGLQAARLRDVLY